jgi:hypothetical protein
MLFVCLSHFDYVYLRGTPPHELQFTVVHRIAMLASPTFIVISGLLLGFLHRTRPEGMPALKAKFIDPGLFLFTFSPLWPLLFVASAAVVVAVGLLWERHGNNDVFGVGYRRLAAATRHRAQPAGELAGGTPAT